MKLKRKPGNVLLCSLRNESKINRPLSSVEDKYYLNPASYMIQQKSEIISENVQNPKVTLKFPPSKIRYHRNLFLSQ